MKGPPEPIVATVALLIAACMSLCGCDRPTRRCVKSHSETRFRISSLNMPGGYYGGIAVPEAYYEDVCDQWEPIPHPTPEDSN